MAVGLPRGPLLAFDTSGPGGAVAVGRIAPAGEEGEAAAERVRILARRSLPDRRGQSALLVPRISEALEEAGLGRRDLEGIVVGGGPGSFTGVRVAAATAKGLVRGLELPLWAPSSLAAAAVSGGEGEEAIRPGIRYVVFDARADRVYAACYEVETEGIAAVIPPRPDRLGPLLSGGVPGEAVFCGSGARRHRDRIRAAGHRVLPAPAGDPDAAGLLRLLSLVSDLSPVENPARWEPEYLRASGAKRTREG